MSDIFELEDFRKKRFQEKFEEALGTKGRLRIIRVLAENGLITKYRLRLKTNLRLHALNPDLKTLTDAHIVKYYQYMPPKYSLNLQNEFVTKIVEFFKSAGYL